MNVDFEGKYDALIRAVDALRSAEQESACIMPSCQCPCHQAKVKR